MRKAPAFAAVVIIAFVLGYGVRGADGGESDHAAAEPLLPVPAAALKAWFPPVGDFDTGGEPLDDERFDALMATLDEALAAEETLAAFGWEADVQLWNFLRRLAPPEITEKQQETVAAYLAELKQNHPDHADMIEGHAESVGQYAAAMPFTPPFAVSPAIMGETMGPATMATFTTGGEPFADDHVDGLLAWLRTMLTIPETVNDFVQEGGFHLATFGLLVQLGALTDDQSDRVVAYLEEVKAGHPEVAEQIDDLVTTIRTLMPGQMAANIVGEDTEGIEFELEDYRGNIVVLVFSGHWCGPCRIEYPYQRFMLELYEDEPVVILGVNSDPALETIQQAKIDEGLDYRTWWDGHGDIPTQGPIATGWKVQGWPTIYVIDEEGVIRNVNKRGGDLIGTVDRMLMEMKARDGEVGAAMEPAG